MIKSLAYIYDCKINELQNLSNKKNLVSSSKREISISFNSSFTLDFLLEIIPLFFKSRNIEPKILKTNFGMLNIDLNNLNSAFWKNKTDIFVLLPTHRDLTNIPLINSNQNQINLYIKRECEKWFKLWSLIKKPIIQLTYDEPFEKFYGDSDGIHKNGFHAFIKKLNYQLIGKAPSNVTFIDTEEIISNVGITNWHDSRMYNLIKQPFSMDVLPTLAKNISSKIANKIGLSKKVIILDLDNTIWGGVAGEEKVKNLELGNDTPLGVSYSNFQKFIKSLHKKGVILCVCSKNTEKNAKNVFIKNKSMILKLSDITIFKANFKDKATNMREISKSLNLGLDSFVFIDDSLTECELIKKEIPEIFTIHLNGDPSNYSKKIEKYNLFKLDGLTKEDFTRNISYKKIIEINKNLNKKTNLDLFLKSLKPVAIFEKVNNTNVGRISEILQKTNQFKLSNKVFSIQQIRKLKSSFISIRLKDKMQDFGIVTVVFFEKNKKLKQLEIKNWVMSCRVFGRRLEYFLLENLIKISKKEKFNQIIFNFKKLERNIPMEEFLKNIKVKKVNKETYKLDISNFKLNQKNYINCK